jgi:hypothetical protein
VPVQLRWAAGLLGAEAAGAAALAIFLGYEDLSGTATRLRDALLVTGFVVLLAAALGGLAVALYRRQSWARSPSIVLQLLLLPTAYLMISSGLAWLGIPIGVAAVAVVGLLISSASRDALGIR